MSVLLMGQSLPCMRQHSVKTPLKLLLTAKPRSCTSQCDDHNNQLVYETNGLLRVA